MDRESELEEEEVHHDSSLSHPGQPHHQRQQTLRSQWKESSQSPHLEKMFQFRKNVLPKLNEEVYTL